MTRTPRAYWMSIILRLLSGVATRRHLLDTPKANASLYETAGARIGVRRDTASPATPTPSRHFTKPTDCFRWPLRRWLLLRRRARTAAETVRTPAIRLY